MQRSNVPDDICKCAFGHEFQIVPAGNAELDCKFFQVMRSGGLDNPDKCMFEPGMIHILYRSDSIFFHQRLQVRHTDLDYLLSRLAIVDWAVVPVMRTVNSP